MSNAPQSLNVVEKKLAKGISIKPIADAIKPYSIAVDPLSSTRRRLMCLMMARTTFKLPFRRNSIPGLNKSN